MTPHLDLWLAVGDTTGVRLHEDRLTVPLHWRKPRRVFVCSMADLFHESIPDEFIARVFAVMALAPQHTFQILTKRPGRMRSLLGGWGIHNLVMDRFANDDDLYVRRALAAGGGQAWPLPNVWIGVSVEDQKSADLRIPILLDTPAAVRWLSCEPLLGPVDISRDEWLFSGKGNCVDWVVVGGESGPGARPMHPDWARSLRDQCAAADVPFLFKQWGEWAPDGFDIGPLQRGRTYVGPITHRQAPDRSKGQVGGMTCLRYPDTDPHYPGVIIHLKTGEDAHEFARSMPRVMDVIECDCGGEVL